MVSTREEEIFLLLFIYRGIAGGQGTEFILCYLQGILIFFNFGKRFLNAPLKYH